MQIQNEAPVQERMGTIFWGYVFEGWHLVTIDRKGEYMLIVTGDRIPECEILYKMSFFSRK